MTPCNAINALTPRDFHARMRFPKNLKSRFDSKINRLFSLVTNSAQHIICTHKYNDKGLETLNNYNALSYNLKLMTDKIQLKP